MVFKYWNVFSKMTYEYIFLLFSHQLLLLLIIWSDKISYLMIIKKLFYQKPYLENKITSK